MTALKTLRQLFLWQVKHAESCGARGVILYTDPSDFTAYQKPVYPDTWWLPGSAVQRGTISTTTGDVLTPHLPATGTSICNSVALCKVAAVPT